MIFQSLPKMDGILAIISIVGYICIKKNDAITHRFFFDAILLNKNVFNNVEKKICE